MQNLKYDFREKIFFGKKWRKLADILPKYQNQTYLRSKSPLSSHEGPQQTQDNSHQSNGYTFRGNDSAQENQLTNCVRGQLNPPGYQYGFTTNIKLGEEMLYHERNKDESCQGSTLIRSPALGAQY